MVIGEEQVWRPGQPSLVIVQLHLDLVPVAVHPVDHRDERDAGNHNLDPLFGGHHVHLGGVLDTPQAHHPPVDLVPPAPRRLDVVGRRGLQVGMGLGQSGDDVPGRVEGALGGQETEQILENLMGDDPQFGRAERILDAGQHGVDSPPGRAALDGLCGRDRHSPADQLRQQRRVERECDLVVSTGPGGTPSEKPLNRVS